MLQVTVPTSYNVYANKIVLLLRHDMVNGGKFPLHCLKLTARGKSTSMKNDPEAPNYSIFGEVDNFKDKNGVSYFE